MTPKEKKAFVARMKKARAAANRKSLTAWKKRKATPRPKVPAHQRITKAQIKRKLKALREDIKRFPDTMSLKVERDKLLWQLENWF